MRSRRNSVEAPAPTASRFRTEDWVFSGLSVPRKVVLAKPSTAEKLSPGGYVHLVGNEHALGLAQFLGHLALGRKVSLRYEWQRGQLFEHWYRTERVEKLKKGGCRVLLLLLDSKIAKSEDLAAKLRELVERAGTMKVKWILPLEDDAEGANGLRLALPAVGIEALGSHLVPVHRAETGAPSARGYAGWAGAVWGWIR